MTAPHLRDTEPVTEPGPDELRARGSLKWTGTSAGLAAWVAEADFGTAPAVTDALRAAVADGVLGYLPPAARRAMAEACAEWYATRYGWSVPAEQVMPVGDVRDALRIVIDTYSRPDSPVVVPTPTYMPFLSAPGVWGREVLQVPMAVDDAGRPTPDLAGIDAALAAGGHLVVLINPHNPTGRVLAAHELAALAEVVEARGGRVFADEIHAPLVHRDHRHVPYASVSPAAARHTVTATSASKAWNVAGLKCAQVLLSNPDDVAVWRPHDVLLTEGASTPGAVANAAAYRAGGPWLDEVLTRLDRNRRDFAAALADAVPDARHRLPEGTYLAWVDLRAALDRLGDAAPAWRTAPVGELGRWIRERCDLEVTDGAACGTAGRGHVRVNLATSHALVLEIARRLGSALG